MSVLRINLGRPISPKNKSAAVSPVKIPARPLVAASLPPTKPDHAPKATWFGDRPYRSIGFCCEWHRRQGLGLRGAGTMTLSQDPYDPLFGLAPK